YGPAPRSPGHRRCRATAPHHLDWTNPEAALKAIAEPRRRQILALVPGNVAAGEFVEIDRPHRLVFTWGWEGGASPVAPGSTTIEFELVPDGEGTLLRFRHSNLPSAEATASHSHGWDHYLERLAAVGAGTDPGVDRWIAGPMS